ncbi:hypothetical protein BU14_0251s0008 [Porphyra umbilicalis]|uniref:Uncharacterized protein n=1 Tax=Porphyra umbilicalis TaxID=2786 RepID=A0A1X6P2U8_PORUM|nr:hypothetical protein BU14_0251s0008 [Porphyra umbilicalis]|eukprot:OSX75168.1 hypothetical protein BU14_0251s0008 [Porphyra umbilicalis]
MRVGGGGPPLPLVGARWGRRSVVFVMAVFREKGPVLRILPWHQHPQYSSMIPSVTLGAWQWSSCSSPVDFIFTTASGAVGPLPGEELGRLVGREHQHLGLRWPPVILIPTCATCDPLKSNRPDCSRCGQQQRLPRGSDAVIMSVDDGGRSPFCGRFAVGVRQSCGAALCCLFWGYCVRLEPLRSNWCAWRCVLCFYGCLVFFESLPHVPSVPCLCCSPRPDRRAQPCSKAAVADDPSVPIVGARLRRDVWVCHAVPIPLSVPPIQCFSLPCRRAFFVACSRVDCCPPPSSALSLSLPSGHSPLSLSSGLTRTRPARVTATPLCSPPTTTQACRPPHPVSPVKARGRVCSSFGAAPASACRVAVVPDQRQGRCLTHLWWRRRVSLCWGGGWGCVQPAHSSLGFPSPALRKGGARGDLAYSFVYLSLLLVVGAWCGTRTAAPLRRWGWLSLLSYLAMAPLRTIERPGAPPPFRPAPSAASAPSPPSRLPVHLPERPVAEAPPRNKSNKTAISLVYACAARALAHVHLTPCVELPRKAVGDRHAATARSGTRRRRHARRVRHLRPRPPLLRLVGGDTHVEAGGRQGAHRRRHVGGGGVKRGGRPIRRLQRGDPVGAQRGEAPEQRPSGGRVPPALRVDKGGCRRAGGNKLGERRRRYAGRGDGEGRGGGGGGPPLLRPPPPPPTAPAGAVAAFALLATAAAADGGGRRSGRPDAVRSPRGPAAAAEAPVAADRRGPGAPSSSAVKSSASHAARGSPTGMAQGAAWRLEVPSPPPPAAAAVTGADAAAAGAAAAEAATATAAVAAAAAAAAPLASVVSVQSAVAAPRWRRRGAGAPPPAERLGAMVAGA